MQTSAQRVESITGSPFLQRIFYGIVALAIITVALGFAGRYFGHTISLGGHTEETALHEIVIGNNVLSLPANTIRFRAQRRDGVAQRVDLYLHWPDMQGYQAGFIKDFNGAGETKTLLFLTFEPRATSRDMSGRYGPIYSTLTDGPGIKGPSGLTIQNFRANTGFVSEQLAVSPETKGRDFFVARCLDEETSKTNLASCQRDIFIGEDLQLTYRFPREFLANWQELDQRVRAFAQGHLKTPK
jgi:hypothetical protein